ncbi:transposase family protein [Nocardia yunnanensis]|uniref:transposase family protein n=1 Tax=Nocardia yunnanensis TaxID=2382165 RepID=UPI001CA46056|nr:transposase family protein [Nocardia yunnanensis]
MTSRSRRVHGPVREPLDGHDEYCQPRRATLADAGYDGAGIGVHTPVKQPSDGRDLDIDTRTRNALLRGLRCLAERGFALLTGRWRALRHFTTSPEKIGDIVKAALVLTHFEHGRHQ